MTYRTEFQVALSFAGENRDFVAQVADYLKNEGVSTFYDQSEGKNLAATLEDICRKKARYVVIFISAAYAKKAWTTFENGSALAGAIARIGQKLILPARFDDTDIPGLIPTIGYIELRKHTPQTFADLVIRKMRSQADLDLPADTLTLTEILSSYLKKSPYKSRSEVIRSLNLNDWTETVSLGWSGIKTAPKPTRAEEIVVTTFEPNLVYRVVLSTQSEKHYTFRQTSCPSNEVRAKCTSSSASPREFYSKNFDCHERYDEHATGALTYDTCNLCNGAGIITENCRACSGSGMIDQIRCDKCRKGTVLALCNQCDGTGYLDIFPFAGNCVSQITYIVFQNLDGVIP